LTDSPFFTSATFEWLAAIHQRPTLAFYISNKLAFKEWIELPFQRLLRRVAERLSPLMRSLLETQRNVFSRFPKNDFGRGGAWDNYWGAFYPRGSRRIADAQLAVWLDYQHLQISFYINDYGVVPRQRFVRNCIRYQEFLPELLHELVANPQIVLERQAHDLLDEHGDFGRAIRMTWREWFSDPAAGEYLARLPFSPQQAIEMPASQLVDRVSRTFALYFPLLLLSAEEDPLPIMKAYLKGIDRP
jgi:5-methylcytosine-specific restriction protein B